MTNNKRRIDDNRGQTKGSPEQVLNKLQIYGQMAISPYVTEFEVDPYDVKAFSTALGPPQAP